MSDVLPAIVIALAAAWIANKWASGDFEKREDRVEVRETEKEKTAFGAWASKALAEFDELRRDASRGGECSAEGLRNLYAARSAIMENYYARIRYAPNDDETLSGLEFEAREADVYMTNAIEEHRKTNRSLRFVRYPLNCGDGDSLFPVTS